MEETVDYKQLYLEEKIKHCDARLENAQFLSKIAELQQLYTDLLKAKYLKELNEHGSN